VHHGRRQGRGYFSWCFVSGGFAWLRIEVMRQIDKLLLGDTRIDRLRFDI